MMASWFEGINSRARYLLVASVIGTAATNSVGIAQPPQPRAPELQVPAQPNSGTEDQTPAGVEVLTRGPIHEAFAGPVVYNPKPGSVSPAQPPAPIEELPPDQKPSGDAVWVPGYWNWDEERKDYLWVSGIWREPPPGMAWVPGYWGQVTEGYQWTSGFWQQSQQEEIEYLPSPPPSVENGPNIEQPSENFFWIPGNYEYRVNRYVWRPGYWYAYQPGWVWVPASYRWTPYGYVYVAGYWDLPLETRGILFAPVAINRPLYVSRYYTPSVVLNIGCVTTHLFARPTHVHYYFGDFYDTTYVSAGYYPWFQYNRSRIGFDPLFNYYSVAYYRTNPRWAVTLSANFNNCRRDPSFRPPRTFVQQNVVVNNITTVNKITNINNTTIVNNVVNNININNTTVNKINNVSMATGLHTAVKNKSFNNIQVAQLDNSARQQFQNQSLRVRMASEQRVSLEKTKINVGAGNITGQVGKLRSANEAIAISRPEKIKLPQQLVTNLDATKSKIQVQNTDVRINNINNNNTTINQGNKIGNVGNKIGNVGNTGVVNQGNVGGGQKGMPTGNKISNLPGNNVINQPGGTNLGKPNNLPGSTVINKGAGNSTAGGKLDLKTGDMNKAKTIIQLPGNNPPNNNTGAAGTRNLPPNLPKVNNNPGGNKINNNNPPNFVPRNFNPPAQPKPGEKKNQ